MKFVDINNDNECILWVGHTNKGGYGKFWCNKKKIYAHRWVWEYSEGPIPDGMVLDHKCRVRSCVNTDHLRVVTCQINAVENSKSIVAINAIKTHCPQGHEYTKENTYINSVGGRWCKICRKEHMKKCDSLPERMAYKKSYMKEYNKKIKESRCSLET